MKIFYISVLKQGQFSYSFKEIGSIKNFFQATSHKVFFFLIFSIVSVLQVKIDYIFITRIWLYELPSRQKKLKKEN